MHVVAVFGPTASGKSAVAVELAERIGGEIVSCDAMQLYRGLPILTNQPSTPTRLVGIRALGEEMSVGAFAELAHREIDALVHDRGIRAIRPQLRYWSQNPGAGSICWTTSTHVPDGSCTAKRR